MRVVDLTGGEVQNAVQPTKKGLAMNEVRPGDVVRLYEEDDWFRDGMVVAVTDGAATIDFDLWVERIPVDWMRVSYIHFKRVLLPDRRGMILEDFPQQTERV